jgi:hypothetical protein
MQTRLACALEPVHRELITWRRNGRRAIDVCGCSWQYFQFIDLDGNSSLNQITAETFRPCCIPDLKGGIESSGMQKILGVRKVSRPVDVWQLTTGGYTANTQGLLSRG